MVKKINILTLMILAFSCSHNPNSEISKEKLEKVNTREIASQSLKLGYSLDSYNKFTTGFNPWKKMWHTGEHYIAGELVFEKINGETTFILDLDWWYGSRENDTTGGDALCPAELGENRSPATVLAKNMGWTSFNLQNLEQLTKDDLVEACEKIGGVPMKKDEKIVYTEIASSSNIRVRGLGTGYSGLIPAPRKCLFYRAKMKCDLSNIRTEVQELIVSQKKRCSELAQNKTAIDPYWDKCYKNLDRLEKEME